MPKLKISYCLTFVRNIANTIVVAKILNRGFSKSRGIRTFRGVRQVMIRSEPVVSEFDSYCYMAMNCCLAICYNRLILFGINAYVHIW